LARQQRRRQVRPRQRHQHLHARHRRHRLHLVSHTRAADTSTDSFFAAVDNGAPINYESSNCSYTSAWTWVELLVPTNSPTHGAPEAFALSAGSHTFTLTSREGGSAIDRIIVMDDSAFVPTD